MLEKHFSTGASIRISIRISDNRCRLILESISGQRIEVDSDLNTTQLQEQRNNIRKTLIKVNDNIGVLKNQNLNNLKEAMFDLHKRGRLLLLQLFNENKGNTLNEAIELCRNACPGWDHAGWNSNDSLSLPKLIEYESSIEDIIPVEILPLFDFSRPDVMEEYNLNSLAKIACSFLGFSSIIRRIIRKQHLFPIGTFLENLPKLPIKFFHHQELGAAFEELSFFKSNEKYLDLDGPWPDMINFPDKIKTENLIHYLWWPEKSFSGSSRNPPDQILHFACHCFTDTELSEDYHFKLAARNNSLLTKWHHYTIKISDLQDEFGQLRYSSGDSHRNKPLVFFNTCGATNMDPTKFYSFPKLFLDYGFLGFIGPQIPVDDSFASEFSKAFYTELLKGTPLGLSLYKARWKMMKKYQNPLGILYSAYADPDIRVRVPPYIN